MRSSTTRSGAEVCSLAEVASVEVRGPVDGVGTEVHSAVDGGGAGVRSPVDGAGAELHSPVDRSGVEVRYRVDRAGAELRKLDSVEVQISRRFLLVKLWTFLEIFVGCLRSIAAYL